MPIDLRDQYFGTEIEMTGITRQRAAQVVAEMFGTDYYHRISYDSWCVRDQQGKEWKFSSDGSIITERKVRGLKTCADGEFATEMVSPKLEYSEMGKLQEVVRCLRHHGAFVNWSRYYALNLHAVFSKGTLEWRCFESTLHAGEVRANITLALAISAQAINQKCTQMRKTEISENPAFTFRTFLLRLGLIGPEYKNVREHLLKNLEGDRAWRYDKSQYACLQQRNREQETR